MLFLLGIHWHDYDEGVRGLMYGVWMGYSFFCKKGGS